MYIHSKNNKIPVIKLHIFFLYKINITKEHKIILLFSITTLFVSLLFRFKIFLFWIY